MLTSLAHQKVALLDLDLQFGAIPLYFDLFPKRGVLQALENSEGLDGTAFDGYLVRHSSGLKILGHAAEDPLSTQAVNVHQVQLLLKLALKSHDHVVIDLPRRIDALSTLVVEQAQHVVVVVQQSVATLRDATRLINCLRRELGVSKDRIVAVVNRYQKDARITTEDIRTTLGCAELALIPSDFATVSACLDSGAALLSYAPNASITRAVEALQITLGGAGSERQGFLGRSLSGFIKSRSP
jgi:pilus assembly protein CpaE